MMTPRQLVDLIARAGNPAKELKAIDYYIQLKAKALKRFALPEQDAHLLPVINFLGFDLEKLRAFSIQVRREVERIYGSGSSYYANCYEVTRKLDGRFAQQKRRSRLQRAMSWAKIHMSNRTTDERHRWMRQVEIFWKKQRLAALKTARLEKRGPLTEDEKEEVLDEFWNDLDVQIAQGTLPSWDELMGDN